MPDYILLSRLFSHDQRKIAAEPAKLKHIRGVLEQWEATIKADYHLFGEYHHCTVFEVSDNFCAQRAVLNEELTDIETSLLIPAIDLNLFEKLFRQEI